MERDYAIGMLQREAERVLQLANVDGADPTAPVPSCPDWDFAELLKHLGNIYNWAGTIVEGRLSAPPGPELPRRPQGMSPEAWLADRLDRILAALRDVPDDADMWNFAEAFHGPPAFWWRRQVHETIIHRVDAELTCSVPVSALEPELAADNVSELFEVIRFSEPEPRPEVAAEVEPESSNEPEGAGAPATDADADEDVDSDANTDPATEPATDPATEPGTDPATEPATSTNAAAADPDTGPANAAAADSAADPANATALVIHLHATDLEGAEWTIDTVARTIARTHAKGDVALRGTAWALARWCWGRPVAGELEVFGDLEAAEAWRRTVAP
jgi:uncharacterized protein (TIGR03083 family)